MHTLFWFYSASLIGVGGGRDEGRQFKFYIDTLELSVGANINRSLYSTNLHNLNAKIPNFTPKLQKFNATKQNFL